VAEQPIADTEQLIRHIPGGTTWQAPGPRITSKNFELRPGETGISVSREDITPADVLMARLGNPTAGSRIAVEPVAAIRALGLEVVPDPKDYDTGHAEIRAGSADLSSHALRKKLANLFAFLPPEATPTGDAG
jgi:hypothetical protein